MQKIGKEIKIGLAVIGVMVAAFGYILFRKLTRPDDLAAAPSAATAPGAVAPAAGSSEKPTIVSATVTGRPADPATDAASSSRSLFSSPHHSQASDSADAGAEPRGSFMPAANNVAASNGSAATSGAAPGNGAALSNVAPQTSSLAAPENRFSQFGHHDNAPSAFKSGTAATVSTTDTASDAAAKPLGGMAGNGNHSLFTSSNNTPPADTAPEPAAVAPAAVAAGGAPSDPLERRSPMFGSRHERVPTASLAETQSPGVMPADPVPPPQAAPSNANDGNPLRPSNDFASRSVSAPLPDVVSSAGSPSAFGATSSPPQMAPPPVTPNAINVPSSQLAPSDPVSPPPPQTADAGAHKPGQYVVQPNDNYWTVSEKAYGTGGYFKAIYEHNRRQHSQSDRLQVGDTLDVPDVAVLQQMYPELCPKSGPDAVAVQATAAVVSARPQPPGTRRYVVADGDTLFEIARRELGQSSRWGEIYQLNHDQLGNNFDYLHAGTELMIPSDSAATVAREPSGSLQR